MEHVAQQVGQSTGSRFGQDSQHREVGGGLGAAAPADLVLLRADAVILAPMSAADAIELAAHPGNVDTVRVAKRSGALPADTDRARSLAAASASRLLGARAGPRCELTVHRLRPVNPSETGLGRAGPAPRAP